MKVYKRKLASGLRVVIVPKNTSPIVTVNISYQVGSKDEKAGKTGLAHLFEHLMFEGTPNVPKGKFDQICSEAGGTNNAYTTYDWTTYYMTVPKTQLELALWLEADRLYNYKLEQSVLDIQKDVVTEEIYQTVIDRPYGQWRDYLSTIAFRKDCSYSWEVQGLIEDVRGVTLEDANEFRNKYYKPSNAVLSICGDVDVDNTFSLIEKYFSQGNGTTKLIERNQFSSDMRLTGGVSSYEDNVPHSAVFVSFHCAGFAEGPEDYVAKIYTDIMARGKSSKLYNSLVYEKEIASHAGVFFDKRENSSLLTFFIVANENSTTCDDLYSAIMEEIVSAKRSSFFASDLERSKNYVKTTISGNFLKTGGIADLVSTKEMFQGNPEEAFNLIEKYDAITMEDIEQFMEKRIIVQNAIRVNVVPKQESVETD
ncbi:MAG: insulinase family protein [Ignavibacteriae bacterium]|nr:insulinase family protein [Ignavibacteriota bacterium]MCB9221755.1 insulinase family protein [Ignavibacteria bacterium]